MDLSNGHESEQCCGLKVHHMRAWGTKWSRILAQGRLLHCSACIDSIRGAIWLCSACTLLDEWVTQHTWRSKRLNSSPCHIKSRGCRNLQRCSWDADCLVGCSSSFVRCRSHAGDWYMLQCHIKGFAQSPPLPARWPRRQPGPNSFIACWLWFIEPLALWVAGLQGAPESAVELRNPVRAICRLFNLTSCGFCCPSL